MSSMSWSCRKASTSAASDGMTRKPWADKGSRRERGYGAAWDRIRLQVLQRDKWLCQECMRQGKLTPLCVKPHDHAVDHVIPKVQGGTDDMGNLQSLCVRHHQEKTARDEGWNRAKAIGNDGWPVE